MSTGRPRAGRDWRLVPAAALTWGVCGWGVGLGGSWVWVMVLVLLTAATLLVHRLRRLHGRSHPGRPHPGRSRPRHRRVQARSLGATAALTVLVAAAVLATAVPRLEWRAEQVSRVDGTSAEVQLRLTGDPVPLAERPGVRIEAVLLTAGRSLPVASLPVLVLASEEWARERTGGLVTVTARLAATEPGQERALLVIPAGPGTHEPPQGWRATVAALRTGLVSASEELPPASRGLVPGIAIGDDRVVPPALREAMRTTSLTHLTAVSGAHVALVLGLVLALGWWLPPPARSVVGAFVLIAFVALVHPDGSVLRSAVMGAVLLLGLALRRPRAALPALAAAVIALLAADPWLARSYGFALSVLATGGLLVGSGPIASWLARWLPEPLSMALAVPAAAQIACTPVLLLLDPAIPLYAVPANLMAAPAVAPATVLGLAAALVGPLSPGAAEVLVQPASWCTAWIAAVAHRWAALPGAALPWPAV
ncbi:ComEC/Rec2 family competence protein [Ruania suaedae]|uniref:ComEC/Rec2 family competence protein n=1 Tax=Ruania suaedae TaxID=2897774 RepID=UPI001E3ECFD4|nr:ComEC/Rec2 family competence protein [Ruania suaedae]UFU01761.1 ComEC/Rec2 family competence protein [Ruania suaedae]